jgi:hypothetical protein
MFEILRQPPKKTLQVISPKKRDPKFSLITNRGLAQRSWGWMLGKLGMGRGDSVARASTKAISGKNYVKVSQKIGALEMNPFVRLVNRLSYIKDAYPGIVRNSLEKARKQLVFYSKRGVRRAIKR